jgi:hypothetical protein
MSVFGFKSALEIGFVRRSAAFCDAQEFVFAAGSGHQVDLRREIIPRIFLLIHVEGGRLRIAQILLRVGLVNPLAQSPGVLEVGPDTLAFFANDIGGAGVLAKRENAFRGHFCVAQHREGDIAVVVARLGIVQNGGHLREMGRPQHERAVPERRARHRSERLRGDLENRLPLELANGNAVAGQEIIFGFVFPERERVLVLKSGRHK